MSVSERQLGVGGETRQGMRRNCEGHGREMCVRAGVCERCSFSMDQRYCSPNDVLSESEQKWRNVESCRTLFSRCSIFENDSTRRTSKHFVRTSNLDKSSSVFGRERA